MDDLQTQIAELLTDYLLKVTRGNNGDFDHVKQANVLMHMVQAPQLASVFQFDYASHINQLDAYNEKLQALLQNRDEQTRHRANQSKRAVFENALANALVRMREEHQITFAARDTWRLKQQIADLQAMLEFQKPLKQVTFWDRLIHRLNFPYLMVLVLAIVLIAGLAILGMNTTMTVNVEFSVGDILAALLVGTGVAAAGISYATRDRPAPDGSNE